MGEQKKYQEQIDDLVQKVADATLHSEIELAEKKIKVLKDLQD